MLQNNRIKYNSLGYQLPTGTQVHGTIRWSAGSMIGVDCLFVNIVVVFSDTGSFSFISACFRVWCDYSRLQLIYELHVISQMTWYSVYYTPQSPYHRLICPLDSLSSLFYQGHHASRHVFRFIRTFVHFGYHPICVTFCCQAEHPIVQ
jgi:hypothetical protein